MNVHKILTGEGAEKHLPFALSKLRLLARTSRQIVVQKFDMGDARVIVEYNPLANQHHVRIDANPGTLGYEFFTTYDLTGNYAGSSWWATAVRPAPNGLVAAKLSTSFGNQQPPLVPFDPMSRAINLQRNAQYHWWPVKANLSSTDAIRTKSFFMTSTLGIPSWQANAQDFQSYLSSFSWVRQTIARNYEFGTDLAVDVPVTLYERGVAKSAMPYPTLPDWPRRAAVMEVGGRSFVIMSDMHSNFRAFPASYLTGSASKYLFHPTRAKVVRPADYMPAKVARPGMDTMTPIARGLILPSGAGWYAPEEAPYPVVHPYSEFPGAAIEPGADEKHQYQTHHYLWDFHPSGAKAVAVVHTNKTAMTVEHLGAREPVTVLSEYGPQYRIGVAHATDQWVVEAGGATELKVCERAVLEVEFQITITGSGEDDFTFDVVPSRLIDDGWYFDAQYAYTDPRLEALNVGGGELLTDELRLWGVPPGEPHDVFMVTRNQDRAFDVASFCVTKNRPFTMYESFRHVNLSMGTYAGTPPAIYRWFLVDGTPVGDYGLSKMVASDLRSMSKVFHQTRNGDPAPLHAVVFGETRQGTALSRTEVESAAGGLQRMATGFVPASPADDIASSLPMALHRLVWDQCVNGYGFDISVAVSMATHPDGHFAVFCHHYDAVETFDLIEYRRVTDGIESFDQTTHVAAWETAFGIAFDPVAYADMVVSDNPLVLQRFASWRNVRLPMITASAYASMNERLKNPI